ncbi:hypothetical protein FQZ97_661700 [compost metagenome]
MSSLRSYQHLRPSPAPTRTSRRAAILRILGVLLMLFSCTQVPPLLIDLYYAEGAWRGFLLALLITLAVGLLTWLPVRDAREELKIRDGYLITALFWVVLGSFGSIPFLLVDTPHMSWVDALFESVSASSCNGSAAWASSSWPWPSCRCSASAACSCTVRKCRGR